MDAEMGLGEMPKAALSMLWALQELAFIHQDCVLNWKAMCMFSVVYTHLTHKLLLSMSVFTVFLRIAQVTEQDGWKDALPLSILHTKGLFNNHYILSLEWHFKPFLPYLLIIALFASQTEYANPHNMSLQWNEKLPNFYCLFSSLLPPGQKPPSNCFSHLVGVSWADKVKPSRSEIITKR